MDLYHHLLATVDAAPRRPILRLACLLHDIGKAKMKKRFEGGSVSEDHETLSAQISDRVTKRLRLSNHDRRYIHQLVEHHRLPFQQSLRKPNMRRFLSRIDTRFLDDLFILSMANLRASGAGPSAVQRLTQQWKLSKEILTAGTPLTISELAINGETVKKILGTSEGVQIGRILRQLLDIILEEPEKNNPHDLALLVKDIGQSQPHTP
jgi:putative nucleotidyltransferase with HDIG domain